MTVEQLTCPEKAFRRVNGLPAIELSVELCNLAQAMSLMAEFITLTDYVESSHKLNNVLAVFDKNTSNGLSFIATGDLVSDLSGLVEAILGKTRHLSILGVGTERLHVAVFKDAYVQRNWPRSKPNVGS